MGTTEQIAQFVVDTNYISIPAETVRRAKDAILDSPGVILAGSGEMAGKIIAQKIIAQYVREIGSAPQARVISNGFKSAAPQAR